jgi:hypothetical protein
MEFKEKIKAHQNGEYDLAAELLKLAQSDMVETKMVCKKVSVEQFNKELDQHEMKIYPRWRPQYPLKKDIPEYHLAYNLRVFIVKHGKKAKGIMQTLNVGLKEQKQKFDGEDFLYTTLTDLGYHYHVDEFHKIPKSVIKEIENSFGENYDDWYTFKRLYMDYINILRYVNKEIGKLHNEIAPLILESLYEVIPLIDLERTDKQIIGFMTISVKNRTYRKLTKLLGNKVHQINGEKYYVLKKDSKMKHTIIDKMLDVNEGKLTNNQMNFYRKLKKFIQVEIDARNTSPFTFSVDGEIININKRYFAEKCEMKESAFKYRLSRLQDKKDKDFFAQLG